MGTIGVPMFIMLTTVATVMLIALCVSAYKSYNRSFDETYGAMSDKDILTALDEQPDKILDAKSVARRFGISKVKAGARLRALQYAGVVQMLYNKSMTKGFYTLSKPIERSFDLTMSEEPFMTLEDLLVIFKHYDYQVTMQELILVTGLPLKVIKREMKHFEDEKIIRIMLKPVGQSYKRIYLLNEPYRSNPDAFLQLDHINFELQAIYEKAVDELV